MDHLFTYEEAAGFLKNPPTLAPCPEFAKICALRKHIVMALKQIVCPQSTIHRRLVLVMDLVMYKLIEPTTPFVLVANQGSFPMYNNFTTEAAIKTTNKQFKDHKNYFLSFVNINRVCFCMLNNNIADQFKVSNTPNMKGWNSSMSICSIIKQLKTLYGKPNTIPLFHNNALFRSPFPATKAPEMLFYRIKQCREIQTITQDLYTPKQIIGNAVRLLMQ
jgi:hypothetical protein